MLLHLRVGTTPVVGGKRVERQGSNAHVGCVLHNAACGGDSGAMAGNARQAAPGRPTSIAVHDDGDVQPGAEFALHRKVTSRVISFFNFALQSM